MMIRLCLILVLLTTIPTAAKADHAYEGLANAIITGEVVLLGGGAVVGVVNLVRNDPLTVAGTLFGGLNLVAGGLWMYIADDSSHWVFAVSHLVVGTANLVALVFSPADDPTVAFLPYLLPDRKGGIEAGLSLRVLDF